MSENITNKPPINVLHIEAGKHLYGGALQVVYLCNGLAAYNVKSFLACPINAEISSKIDENTTLVPLKMGGDIDFGMIFRLKNIIKHHNIDLVHIHSRRGADTFGLVAAKLCKVKVVISRRVDNPEPSWLAKLKYHSANKVIAISEGIRQVLLVEQVRPEHVQTVLSSVDTDKYLPHPNKEWFRQEFSINNKCLTLAVIAQLIPRKGHALLLQALANIVTNVDEFRLLIFGKGPHESELKQLVSELKLEHRVNFAGFRDDLEKVLPNIDLVVHPAYIEGLGVSLLQASSCGVPILASRIGGIPEAVNNNVNGQLFEPGNIDELSEKLECLMNKHKLRSELAQNARKHALEHFAVQKMVAGNYAVYCECV